MKESLAILKNCFPNGIPTIVIHHIQPTIRFPSAISQPKNTIHMRFTKNENIPFPYTISFPNGQNANVANLKHCRPTGIPIIVIHHMHPAKIHASPPNMPPNINHRIFPKVLISASPLTPFQTPPAIHYFVNSLPHRWPVPVTMPEFHASDHQTRWRRCRPSSESFYVRERLHCMLHTHHNPSP